MRQLMIAAWLGLLLPTAASAWSLVVEQGRVDLALPDLSGGGWELTGSQADVRPSINATGQSSVIRFAPTSRVVTERLAYTGGEQALLLQNLRADLSELTLTLDYGAPGSWPERVALEGAVKVDASRVEHPLLLPRPWSFKGRVEGPLTDLRIQGVLVSGAGLEVDLEVQLAPEGAVSMSVSSLIDGQEGVRALSESLSGWPELLTVDAGRARLSADVRLGGESGPQLNASARMDGVAGVFNRTAFSGVSGDVLASLEAGRFKAGLRQLTVDQLNPGIPVNAVRVTADYTAASATPLAGRLDVQAATARFLDGTLQIPPGIYGLEGGAGRLPVDINGLSLARLMAVYPAEGLAGSGFLSGRIPIRYGEEGVQVRQGHLSAKAPGGRLQLPADKLQALLGGNQAMDMVVQALQNFHYSVLSSTIDYDETGKLTLDLRIEGRNPEVRGGQPVVLNVNLEDNIPALLTSLQLSGRVNEVVTERVRALLRQSGQEALP